ncbi:hypothetical protein [Sporosarcina limicola]|uniref:Chromosome segregation ATPase n=1 Tax=Sporosarcina limicola TaxID=34101 RepID=A0A927MK68_9BACL|nr:hypothetical protein [Sporosarcina limicola]MBE1556220.1 chromosome segregation ATPase [Sporosarcina limicola]
MKVFSGLKVSMVTKTFSPQIIHKANDESAGKSGKRDSIIISDEARARLGNWQERSASMIESLMEKRQKVQEAKSNLVERTLEAGEELSTIKEQLGAFDEQIAEIEGQMSAIEAQKREREQREQEEKQQAAAETQEKSEIEQLTSLLQSVQFLEQINALKQVKVPIENVHRRLKTEMRNDMERGTFIESKAKKIAELAGRMQNLDSEMNNQIRKAKESSNEMNRKVSAEEKQEGSVSESLEN